MSVATETKTAVAWFKGGRQLLRRPFVATFPRLELRRDRDGWRIGRLAALTRARERHPGLFLTGNAMRGVAVNDGTREAETVARAVVDYLRLS